MLQGSCYYGLGSQRTVQLGGVVEWLMALVLKTSEVRASVGSNPTPSAQKTKWSLASTLDFNKSIKFPLKCLKLIETERLINERPLFIFIKIKTLSKKDQNEIFHLCCPWDNWIKLSNFNNSLANDSISFSPYWWIINCLN